MACPTGTPCNFEYLALYCLLDSRKSVTFIRCDQTGNAYNILLTPCIGHNDILQIIAKARNHTLQRVINQMNPRVFRICETLHIDSPPSSLLLSHLKDTESFNTQQHSSHRYRIRKCYERQLISGLEILALLYQKQH